MGPLGARVTAIELHTGDGHAAIALLRAAPPGSRLVGLCDEHDTLDRAHAYTVRALAGRAAECFLRRDDLSRLQLASGVADLVFSCLPFRPRRLLRSVLAEGLRLLKPTGRLIVVTPLRHSLFELAEAVGTAAAPGREAGLERLLSEGPMLFNAQEWVDMLGRAGAVEIAPTHEPLQLTVEPGAHKDPLYARALVPLYLGDQSELVEAAPKLLAQAIKLPLTTTLHLGCFIARRPPAPAADTA